MREQTELEKAFCLACQILSASKGCPDLRCNEPCPAGVGDRVSCWMDRLKRIARRQKELNDGEV